MWNGPRRTARIALRATGFFAMIGVAFGLCSAIRVVGARRLPPGKVIGWWCRRTLSLLGVDVHGEGIAQSGPALVISNHISWLDILVIGAAQESHFVAKSDISGWPVVGWIARSIQTFFIRRGKGGARPLLEQLIPWLQAGGGRVAIFPEGTTTDGRDVLPMHTRLFEAAVAARVPVQPVALRYHADSKGLHIAPFVGDDTLVAHILRVLASPGLRVDVLHGPALAPDAPVAVLANKTEECIRQLLELPPRELAQAA